VKFADEKAVHSAVYRAVREVLPAQITQEPAAAGTVTMQGAQTSLGPMSGLALPPRLSSPTGTSDAEMSAGESRAIATTHEVDVTHEDTLFRPAIFQVHDKYLISPISSGIAIIDQHAAHERILYERAQRSFRERSFNSQQLLFPMLLELTGEEDAVFQEVCGDLESIGFQIRDFGVRTYSVEAVPAGLKRVSEATMIRSMLEEYVEFRRAEFAPRDALAASFACRAAIKAGDSLTSEEMTALVDELFATEFPLTCPHGRPTVIHIKLGELDRRFKRTD
jgi:DNA mismatch repair ATPase MutL